MPEQESTERDPAPNREIPEDVFAAMLKEEHGTIQRGLE